MSNSLSGNTELALTTAHDFLTSEFKDRDFSSGIESTGLTLPQLVSLMAIAYILTSNLDSKPPEWQKLTNTIISRLPDIRLTHHLASLYLRDLASGKHPTTSARRIDLSDFGDSTSRAEYYPLTLRPISNTEPSNYALCVSPENTELAARLRSLNLPITNTTS